MSVSNFFLFFIKEQEMNKRKMWTVMVMLVVLAGGTSARAEVYSFNVPTNDATVGYETATSTPVYPNPYSSYLYMGWSGGPTTNWVTYIMWDVSSLPPLDSVTSAKIRLSAYSQSADLSRAFDVFNVTDNTWSEEDLAYPGPAYNLTAMGTFTLDNASGILDNTSYDITLSPAMIKAAIDSGSGKISVRINSQAWCLFQCYSREAATAARRPQLIIDAVHTPGTVYTITSTTNDTGYSTSGGVNTPQNPYTTQVTTGFSGGPATSWYGYFKWNIPDSLVPTAGTVVSAKARLTRVSTPFNVLLAAYTVTDNSWTEESFDANTPPADTGVISGTVLTDNATNPAAYEFPLDVNAVKNAINAADGNFSVKIGLGPGTPVYNSVTFYSREFSNPLHRPQLILEILPPAGGTLSGTVSLGGYADDVRKAGVWVQLKQGPIVVREEGKFLNNSNQFTLDNVTAGTYDVTVKGYAHLQKNFAGVIVESGAATNLPPVSLIGGDNDGNNSVTSTDLNILAENWGAIGD
jgi:hypothetical protein